MFSLMMRFIYYCYLVRFHYWLADALSIIIKKWRRGEECINLLRVKCIQIEMNL